MIISNALFLLPIGAIGLIFLVPVRIRRGIVFGVSVPVAFAAGMEGQRILRDYRTRGAIFLLVALTASEELLRLEHAAILGLVVAGQIVCNLTNWILAVRQTRRFAVQIPLVRTVSFDVYPVARLEWLAGIALTLPLAFTATYLHFNWEKIPARFPIHWGLDGIANGWANRSIFGVYGAPLVGVCGVCLLLLVRWFLWRSPGSSSRRELYRWFLLMIAAGISITMTFVSLLPLRDAMAAREMKTALAVSTIVLIFIECIFIFLLIKMQVKQGSNGDPYDGTPDKCWYGGAIYYNPQDQAVFVEKRFGIGYTLNFARPVSWVFMVVVLGLAVVPLFHVLLK